MPWPIAWRRPWAWHIREEVRHFVDEVLGKGAAPLSTIADAITAQRLIEACERSVDQRREVDL